MNSVNLIGRLTRDPDSKTKDDFTYARFTLAVDRPKQKGKESECDYIPCKAFGKTAETIAKYLSKGRRIGVEGSIRTDSYTDKDGNKVNAFEVVVNKFEFLDSRNDASVENPVETVQIEGFQRVDDGELPF